MPRSSPRNRQRPPRSPARPRAWWTLSLLVPLAVGLSTDSARADAEARVQEAVGDQLQAVNETTTGLDDVQLARMLLDEADARDAEPVFQQVLLTTAAPLLMKHPDGYTQAEAVVARLGDDFAEDRDRIELELLAAFEQSYRRSRTAERRELGPKYLSALMRAGDRRAAMGDIETATTLYRKAQPVARLYGPDLARAITQKLTALREQQLVQSRAEDLREELAADPTNDEPRVALIVLHTTKLYDHAAAKALA